MLRRTLVLGIAPLLTAFAIGVFAFASQGDTSSLEGKPAPAWAFPVLDKAQTVKLGDLKGSVVVVDYWATWCPPCRASLPHLNDLSKETELASKGLKVFAVNSKEKAEKVRDFVKQNKYTFTVLMDEKGAFGRDYLVEGIPTTVVIGRDGTVKKVFIGYDEGGEKELHQAVEEALKETPPSKPA
jgi:thiol-disulfide isomerase/thioredoxin